MNHASAGFTLIELMIVVAIVAILAAIAIPAYQDFQVRSKVTEALMQMSSCKTSVAEFYVSNSGWTNRQGDPIPSDFCADAAGDISLYIDAVLVSDVGVISAFVQNLGNDLAAGQIDMVPADAAAVPIVGGGQSIYQWICGGAGTDVPSRFRPGSCQG